MNDQVRGINNKVVLKLIKKLVTDIKRNDLNGIKERLMSEERGRGISCYWEMTDL